VGGVRAADWSPDGSEFAIVRRVEGFDQLEYPIGKVLDKTSGYFGSIRVSPDGERIAYSDHPAWGDNTGGVSVIDRSGKKTKLAADFAAIEGVAWEPGGREVWFTSSSGDKETTLNAVDLSGALRVVYPSISPIELFDVAADGRVLVGSHHQNREAIALMAGDAKPRRLVVSGEASIVRTLTPDGRALVVASHLNKDYDAFLVRSDRPGAVRLSSGDSMSISPDGAWSMTSTPDSRILSVTPTGMGPTRTIPNPDGVSYYSIPAWLPDGRGFVATGRKGSEPVRGYVFDLATGKATPFGAAGLRWTSFTVPAVSPDGRYVVYQDADGTPRRWPIGGGEPLPIPGLLPEEMPVTFSEDGGAVFVAGRELPIPIVRIDLATGRRTPWMVLAPEDAAGIRYAIPTITPDGKHWALCTARMYTDLYVVDGLR